MEFGGIIIIISQSYVGKGGKEFLISEYNHQRSDVGRTDTAHSGSLS